MNRKIKIKQLSTYLPKRRMENAEIERLINLNDDYLTEGIIEKLFGLQSRRFAEKNEMVSDLAANAAHTILKENGKENIDFLIFASACADLIEPATCNIVQNKLGLDCPAMDVKNACNSFLSGIHTASAFIKAGIYKNVLVVNGEKLSDAINFKIRNREHLQASLASLSLGDAGAAALITGSEDDSGMFYQKFLTKGQYWDLCTIKGGGSMYPHDPTKNYFEGKTSELRGVFQDEVKDFAISCFDEVDWKPNDIDHLVTHQVSKTTFETICNEMGIDRGKNISIFEKFGNTAAASIPLALDFGIKNRFKSGDKVAILGFAAGLSASVQLIHW